MNQEMRPDRVNFKTGYAMKWPMDFWEVSSLSSTVDSLLLTPGHS